MLVAFLHTYKETDLFLSPLSPSLSYTHTRARAHTHRVGFSLHLIYFLRCHEDTLSQTISVHRLRTPAIQNIFIKLGCLKLATKYSHLSI